LPLKPGVASVAVKTPGYPGFDRPGGRGGTALLRAGQVAGARGAGANEENLALGRVRLARVRARQSLGLRAGWTGRVSHLTCVAVARVARCESEAGERKARIGVSC
jgi:hypothetical protein